MTEKERLLREIEYELRDMSEEEKLEVLCFTLGQPSTICMDDTQVV